MILICPSSTRQHQTGLPREHKRQQTKKLAHVVAVAMLLAPSPLMPAERFLLAEGLRGEIDVQLKPHTHKVGVSIWTARELSARQLSFRMSRAIKLSILVMSLKMASTSSPNILSMNSRFLAKSST